MSLKIQLWRPRNGNAHKRNRSAVGSYAMNEEKQRFPFTVTNMYVRWDEPHYEMVCMLVADNGYSDEEILEEMVPALMSAGLILPEDDLKTTRAGNIIIISRARGYIDIGFEGKVN